MNKLILNRTLPSIVLSIVIGFIPITASSDSSSANKLLNHASAYLAMHGTDPVNWQEWNSETVARAKASNKILFVSSGYFSCHWCHVMQRESYKNPEIAKIINKYFIAVKVDRELNPALDARLIDFAERTTGSAGWPLNVFITPEGHPLVAMTYVPPTQFKDILSNINLKWSKESVDLKLYAQQVAAQLQGFKIKSDPNLKKGLADKYLQQFQFKVFDYADEMQGGFGESLKFPSAPQIALLLDIQKNRPNPRLEQFLRLTLDQMSSQGLWDHIGGGFYRYVVDPAWQVPHFEKMLYNNALHIQLYFDAARILNQKRYKNIAITTLDFLMRDFSTASGALATSLSAVDGNGVEGGSYVWTKEQIKKILSDTEYKIAVLLWGLNSPPALEHGHHLTQKMSFNEIATQLKVDKKTLPTTIKSIHQKLFQARKSRSLPKDDKQLAGWNGLALSAFVQGAIETGREDYRKQAINIKNYIEKSLWKKDQLLRASDGSKSLGIAGLEDYAYVAQGIYDFALFSKKESDMKLTHEIVTQGFKRFYSQFGWLLSENMLLQYGNGELLITDGPMPSAASLLAAVSLRVSAKYKDNALKDLALSSLNVQHEVLSNQPYWYATHIKAITEYQLSW